MNLKSPILSTLATWTGCAIVFGSLLLTLVFPEMHLGVLLAIGVVLGMPLVAVGLWLHPQARSREEETKPFLPTEIEVKRWLWTAIALATFGACVFGPAAIVIAVGFALPSGDTWGIVLVRLLWITSAILGWYWWTDFLSRTVPPWFRGRLSDEAMSWLTQKQASDDVMTPKAVALGNWQLVLLAVVAFGIAFRAIDIDNPALDIEGAAAVKRARGLVLVIEWCRGNPNTVTSSALLVGIASSASYVFRIWRARIR